MRINTPESKEECPECIELINSKCVVEEEALVSIGTSAGSTLNKILRFLDKKVKEFTKKFSKLIYDFQPIYTEGITIANYNAPEYATTSTPLNIPLFLNGKECFEHDVDNTIEYTNEDAYVMFFNHTHCGGVFIEEDDTIQITEISGFPLVTPIVIKNPGDTSFTFTNAIIEEILTQVNTLTGSTFLDIVVDTTLTVNNDVALGLVPAANASVGFLADLTFDYEVLDVGLALKELVTENYLTRPVSGFGVVAIDTEIFSVHAVMGVMTFFDENQVEIVDPLVIANLTQLIIDSEVRPTCCPECSTGLTVDGVYQDDVAAGLGGLVAGQLYQTSGTGAAPLDVAGILMIKQ
jgi:hypothetical protein